MILPIVAYGDPVLRKKAVNIDKDYPELDVLLENMFETMYGAHGIGLAAPQVGRAIRIFLVDATTHHIYLYCHIFVVLLDACFVKCDDFEETIVSRLTVQGHHLRTSRPTQIQSFRRN